LLITEAVETEGLADIPGTSLCISPHASIFATLQTKLSGFFAYTSCTVVEIALLNAVAKKVTDSRIHTTTG
jgi:hypothetical protein